MCRYVYHTLRNSKNTVSTIDEADVVYVYDYCYTMWILADHHAKQHWWLRENYTPSKHTGSQLLSMYRQGIPQPPVDSCGRQSDPKSLFMGDMLMMCHRW